MKQFLHFVLFLTALNTVYSQNDSVLNSIVKGYGKIDSFKFKVDYVLLSGNDITKDDVILREMSLKPGKTFTSEKYKNDLLSIYNTGLFNKVEIIPIPSTDKSILLNVDVQERWYILPLPTGGLEDGEWKKIWGAVNIRWDNFRGRNERLSVYIRLFYNPSLSLSYYVPWIGEKLHLFALAGGSWARTRNKSLSTLGKENGTNTLTYSDENYENIQYRGELIAGKFLTRRFNVFTVFKYNYLRVTSYAPDRTLSPTGVDKYLILGAGCEYDSRDVIEYATKGYYLHSAYERYGLLDKYTNFGRFHLNSQSFIPFYLVKDYYISIASKLYSSIAVGAVLPIYNREFLGYSDEYIRGWKGQAFEGDDKLTLYNEIRIPLFEPRYIDAKQIILLRDLPIIKKMALKHGLYFTVFYDMGTVWFKNQNIFKQKFLNGAGIGLNFIAPFGYVFRLDWEFRLHKPVVGQINLNLNAKF